MGEKYDDRHEAEPRQLRDPSGPGFPPPDYGLMAAGGPQWRQTFGSYDARRTNDVAQMFADARQRLAGAGNDEAAQLAALNDAAERLGSGMRDLELHSNQSDMTLQMLSREGLPAPEVADEELASARRLKKAVSDNVGPFEAFLTDFLAGLRSRALDAAGARVEEAVNRVGQFAYTSTAQLFQRVRHGQAPEPDAAASGTGGTAT